MSTAGDTHLGGEDFDTQLLRHMLRVIKAKHQVDLSGNKAAVTKLRHECERAKRVLSSAHTARIELDSIAEGVDVSEIITRARFEELNSALFKRTLSPVRQALEDADLKKADIDEVVLVGGSTRVPRVQAMLKDYFNGKEPNKGINPDEAVAYGAAVQGAILAGVRDLVTTDLVLLDIAPLTLGLETTGGVMDKLIPRNTRIPTTKKKEYTTAYHGQTAVNNRVFEGERTMSKDNRLLGEFELSGFPKMPKGEAKIEVQFEVNADGILKVGRRPSARVGPRVPCCPPVCALAPRARSRRRGVASRPRAWRARCVQVSAREKKSETEAEITVTGAVKLTEEDIERMSSEAEQFADEDEEAKKVSINRHKLEVEIMDALYDAQDNEEYKDKMSDEEKKLIRAEADASRAWLRKAGSNTTMEEIDEEWKRFTDLVNPVLSKYRPQPEPVPENDPRPEEDDDDDDDDDDFVPPKLTAEDIERLTKGGGAAVGADGKLILDDDSTMDIKIGTKEPEEEAKEQKEEL
jgi:heat shock protein 5